MNKRPYKKQLVRDKVDMSLDDIIRLNKKEQHTKGKQPNKNQQTLHRRRTPRTQGKTKIRSRNNGGVFQVGGSAATKLRTRVTPGVRRIQGVVTGLAARRNATLLKRPAQYTLRVERKVGASALYRTAAITKTDRSGKPVNRPFQQQQRHLPCVHQTVARQATFLHHRGLKVQTLVQKPSPHNRPVRPRPWRTSTSSPGVLTVSIDNPTAMTQPEPPSAWTLHPATAPLAASDVETAEKKIPKGVPLQFDINSVGKPQTSMTLNERFRILKEGRAKKSKGNRFVVVD
ncbi:UAP56-interacting factor-like isoform X2 [Hippocampus zosterae]|uniref:UAP56-interacting factor-like isoform X2 n=1 Tax=Hippocampus zosterae TaxID=109293 RepID=UPI00223CDA48|nr:UAP56-interacting factor-like isoform X2 [Hippocampus zosterae]